MGGALLQRLDRDTQKFAFKASSIVVDGDTRDVWKDLITDSGKVSKRGRLKLVKGASGAFQTVPESNTVSGGVALPNELKLVWLNGQMIDVPTFAEIRERANSYLISKVR
jgi:nicotinamide phosphoribosyltransferase